MKLNTKIGSDWFIGALIAVTVASLMAGLGVAVLRNATFPPDRALDRSRSAYVRGLQPIRLCETYVEIDGEVQPEEGHFVYALGRGPDDYVQLGFPAAGTVQFRICPTGERP